MSTDNPLGPIQVGPFEISSKCIGSFPPILVEVRGASNGDPDCCDILVTQGGSVLEHHENKALELAHPDVPQAERDAALKELRELIEDNIDAAEDGLQASALHSLLAEWARTEPAR